MNKILAALFACIFGGYAAAQTIQSGGGGIFSGSGFSGGVANCVLFNKSSVIGCDSGFAYSGGGAAAIGQNGTDGTLSVIKGSSNSTTVEIHGAAGVLMSNNDVLTWDANAQLSGHTDTGASRVTAGVLAIGNGTAGNTAGIIQTGAASLVNLTTGTNADFLCLASNGTVLLQTSACTISSLRFKPDWKPYSANALTKINALEVGTFHVDVPNRDPNSESLQAGLNAENIAKIAPECAIYENDMKTPKSYRQECVIALLVKAVQELKKGH